MPEFSFNQIKSRTIEDEILGHLREAIVSGKLHPGTHLNETDIAKQMAISRIPIREALKKLEQEGLVVRKPNKGVFVITFTEVDVRETFSLRARLEGMALELAIPNITPQDLTQLRTLVEEQQVAIAERNYELLARLDLRFHEMICQKAGHSRLLKIWHELHAQGQMLLNLRFRLMPDYTPETVPTDHINILDAIERGDTASALQLTDDISERVIRECIEVLAGFSKQEEAVLN